MKKTISIILVLTIVIQALTFNALAMNKGTADSKGVEFKKVKELAISKNKVIDAEQYESDLKNAKTTEEVQEVMKKYKDYFFKVDGTGANPVSINAVIGDTQLATTYAYAARTTYDTKQSSSLSNALNLSLSIGTSWAHPFVGVFMSVLDMFIDESLYGNYSGIIERTLYDYVITSNEGQVWTGDYWVSYAISQKRDTSAQANTVYYKGGVRQPAKNMDLGVIKVETGSYFTNGTFLKSMAKNLYLAGNSPIVYYYYNGTSVNYNNDELFDY